MNEGVPPETLKRGRRFRAFTLIELLVVVAIIAVLAAITYPAYNGIRAHMDNYACANNLRLLAGAAMRFAQDNNGLMPSADWCKSGARKSDAGENYTVKGSLIPYMADWKKPGSASPTEVARCPADNRLHDNKSAWQTYCLNTYAKGVVEVTPGGNPVLSIVTVYSGRLMAIPQPGAMAMFMDGVKPTISSDGSAIYPTTINYTTFTSRADTLYVHKKRINVVFMDGHGEALTQTLMRQKASADNTFWTGGVGQ